MHYKICSNCAKSISNSPTHEFERRKRRTRPLELLIFRETVRGNGEREVSLSIANVVLLASTLNTPSWGPYCI